MLALPRLVNRGLFRMVLLLLLGCSPPGVPSPGQSTEPAAVWDGLTCNGFAALCDRSYDSVTYLTTHNAMSTLEEGWLGANQRYGLSAQLAAGVRGLMLDIYDTDDGLMLCHGLCEFGSRPLQEALADIELFLRENPGEVVTIIFESYVAAAQVMEQFESVGLADLLHPQLADEPWPTLGEMLERRKPLVVLSDREGGLLEGYLPVWDHAWETDWSVQEAEQFTCEPTGRGSMQNALFILNHFLTNPWANEQLATYVNEGNFLFTRAQACIAEHQQNVNFLTVDFYDVGNTLEVVHVLNKVAPESSLSDSLESMAY